MAKRPRGFTLIELMIVVAILGVLVSISIPVFRNLIVKSNEGKTKANLGMIRSALSIYYGDNEGVFPDDLLSLTLNAKYLQTIPDVITPPYHVKNTQVELETDPSDTGHWSYSNDEAELRRWGSVRVGCTHTDQKGVVWTTY
jgi:prepilin-type N-terminal cleavage/methylation domain-containing protein